MKSSFRQIQASLYIGQAGRSVLLMSTESDAAVGRLAVIDGTLNDLLRDLAGEITGQDAAGMTTGKPPRPCPDRPKATAR